MQQLQVKWQQNFERRLYKFFQDQPIKFNFQEVLNIGSLDESFSDEKRRAGVPAFYQTRI